MPTDVMLPELGENVSQGDLVRVLVKIGDTISKDQPVIELETEKAAIEVPTSVGGVVKAIHVKEGQKVKVGQKIVTVDEPVGEKAAPAVVATQEAAPATQAKPAEPAPSVPAAVDRMDIPPAEEANLNRTAAASGASAPIPFRAPASAPAATTQPARGAEIDVPAAPSVRQFAREIGVDITQVKGSGSGGRLTMQDIKDFARSRSGSSTAPGMLPTVPLPEFERFGGVEHKPMSSLRRAIARNLAAAWVNIPHVTQNEKADITALEKLRGQYGKRAEAEGGKLTITAIALKILGVALKKFPQFAASIDMAHEEIIYKHYINIGVAVDTDRGLLVPVIRDVDKKSILQLSVELTQVSEKARSRKLGLDEMEGGVMSITNLGGIGGSFFTPIVNAPEVAILGIARGQMEPVFINGQFEPRLMLPLSLSYDHRVIDGADAARFLHWVVEAFENPFVLSLEG